MEEEREGGLAWTHTLCVTVSGYSLDTGECFKDRGRALAIVPFKPPQPQSSLALFTCSQCRPRPCSVWRSTSWGGCFSGLYGRRKTVTTVTEDLRNCFLTEGIRGEAFPTQSRTLGSPSSRRVWPLACTSLQEKKKTTISFLSTSGKSECIFSKLTLEELLIPKLLNSEQDSEFLLLP